MSRLVILGLMLLCACGGRSYQSSEYVTSKFEKEQLAVVVFKMRGTSNFFGAAPQVTFDLVKIDKQLRLADGEHLYHFAPGLFTLGPWSKEYLYLMVEPGFYIIDNISWTQGNTRYYTPIGALPVTTPVQYGAFEVTPGSVNYIGDLEVYCHQAALHINHANRFEEAKAALEKSHPELAPRLIQADFLPAGYVMPFQEIYQSNTQKF